MIASVVFVTTALAQMPTSPWKKGAPFPEPDEELYGVAANGKLYVMGGWGDGKARGANYEYDPATDKWTKKQPMPRPAHHAALAAVNGKIYAFGGFVAPATTADPARCRMGTDRRRVRVQSGHRFMEAAARRCPASAVLRSPRKSAARST